MERLSREEAEKQIAKKLEEIINIYHEYNSEGKYLSLAYIGGEEEVYFFNNEHYEGGKDADKPLTIFRSIENTESDNPYQE